MPSSSFLTEVAAPLVPEHVPNLLGDVSTANPRRRFYSEAELVDENGNRINIRKQWREEDAANRLSDVRKEFNEGRHNKNLKVKTPELGKVQSLTLPIIKREAHYMNASSILRASPADEQQNGGKAKRRWRKTRKDVKSFIVTSAEPGGLFSAVFAAKAGSPSPAADGGPPLSPKGTPHHAKSLMTLFSPMRKAPPVSVSSSAPPLAPHAEEDIAAGSAPSSHDASHRHADNNNNNNNNQQPPRSAELLAPFTAKLDELRRASNSFPNSNASPPGIEFRRMSSSPVPPMDMASPSSSSSLPPPLPPIPREPSLKNVEVLSQAQRQKRSLARSSYIDNLVGRLASVPILSTEDVRTVVRYMDSDFSGEVDESEFADAVRRAKRGEIEDEKIAKLMTRIDNELRMKQIRLTDLFRMMDASGDGRLSVQELQDGLNMLCDVSWEKELERRKIRRLAGHEIWKNKEDARDKTKKWITAAEGMPEEFMVERNFFCREIRTPARFERYLQVVVSGKGHGDEDEEKEKEEQEDDDASNDASHQQSVGGSQKKKKKKKKERRREEDFKFAYDLDSLEDYNVHSMILQIVDDEISQKVAREKQESRRARRSTLLQTAKEVVRRSRGTSADGESLLSGLSSGFDQDDDGSVTSLDAPSVGGGSYSSESSFESFFDEKSEYSQDTFTSLGNESMLSMGSLGSEFSSASHAASMIDQVRRARGKKEQSDMEIESMVMLLGLNKMSLSSIKQRHFEERLFPHLYDSRTSSLSNDYYLPTNVKVVLARDDLIKHVPKARSPSRQYEESLAKKREELLKRSLQEQQRAEKEAKKHAELQGTFGLQKKHPKKRKESISALNTSRSTARGNRTLRSARTGGGLYGDL